MNALFEAALEYASQGLHVLPLHDPTTGKCSCNDGACSSPGKHPRIQHGLLEATTNEELIRAWWTTWPTANVGIRTGAISGWDVIDQDDGVLLEPVDDVPVSCSHGERRHHWIESSGLKNATNVVPGVDVRGDSGYVVAPPSLHHTGENYYWITTLEEGERRPAPAWLLEAMAKKPEPAPISSADLLPSQAREVLGALAQIPPEDRGIWFKTLLATKTALGEAGWRLFDAWSSTTVAGNYNQAENRRQWKSVVPGDATAETINSESLFWLAQQFETEPPAPPDLESLSFPTSAIDGMAPLMRLAYDWILARSIRPQPILAFAGTLALFSTLTARRYGLPGVRTNLYVMSIAPTGAGKAAPRSAIKDLLFKAQLQGLLGGEDIASDAGISGALERSPVSLFQIDEIGKVFHRWTSFNAKPHEQGIMYRILDLFSANGDMILGKEYSQAGKDKRPRVDLDDPCMVIHGTTTPGFWDALDDRDAASGLLARLLVLAAPPVLVEMNAVDPNAQEPPHELVLGAQKLQGRVGDLNEILGNVKTHMVKVSEEYETAYRALDAEVILWGTKVGPNSGAWQAGSRQVELAQRMALIHAVVSNPAQPVLRADALSWGASLARYSSSLVARKLETAVSSSRTGKSSNRLLAFAECKGGGGVTKSAYSRAFRGIPSKEREGLLADLVAGGYLIETKTKVPSGTTTTTYRVSSHGSHGSHGSHRFPSSGSDVTLGGDPG